MHSEGVLGGLAETLESKEKTVEAAVGRGASSSSGNSLSSRHDSSDSSSDIRSNHSNSKSDSSCKIKVKNMQQRF